MKHVFISTIRNNNNNNNKPTGTIKTGKHMTSGDDSVNRLRRESRAHGREGNKRKPKKRCHKPETRVTCYAF